MVAVGLFYPTMGSHKTISASVSFAVRVFDMLPKTGQTTIYQDGDDGFYQAGAPLSGPRFKDNNDGTISDLVTGLMWQQAANANLVSWSDVIIYCEGLSLAGFNDWRVPNVNELSTLINFSRTNPALTPGFFQGLFYVFWTSTTYKGIPSMAWYVDIITGNVGYWPKFAICTTLAVRS